MSTKKIAIILPAYNEALTIAATIEAFHRAQPDAEIVVVDNRSSDGTGRVARETFARIGARATLLEERRPGKGNAVRKAFLETEADLYVLADADLTYRAEDLSSLLVPVVKGEVDIVVGNRHANSTYRKQNRRPFHNFGNNLVRGLINFLFRVDIQDVMSGYRVMSRRFVKSFPILTEGFELETEMTLHAVDKRLALLELPIHYDSRPEGSTSKLNTFRDGFRVLKTVLWIFKDYRPLPFFTLLSALSFVAAMGLGIPVIIAFMETGLVLRFPTAILATGLMLFSLMFFVTGLILDTVVKFQRADFELALLRDASSAGRRFG